MCHSVDRGIASRQSPVRLSTERLECPRPQDLRDYPQPRARRLRGKNAQPAVLLAPRFFYRRLPLLALLACPLTARAQEPAASETARAVGTYERLCLPCHGALGDGHGPAAPFLDGPAPRDFTSGAYKWRSTPSGASPTLADIERSIARGMPGTSMHAWEATLTPSARRALARYLLELGPRRPAATALRIPEPARATPDLVRRGRVVYERLACATCHGPELRGDGPAAPSLRDATGAPALAYDLTRIPPRGGATPSDLMRTFLTGLDGTPMPSYADALGSRDDLVALAAFVADRVAPAARAVRALGASSFARTDDAWSPLATARASEPASIARERTLWSTPIALQARAPLGLRLAPVERSMRAEQCGRCHADQARDWRGSRHALAMGPGVVGQLDAFEHGVRTGCQRCHAPLSEQHPALRDRGDSFRANALFDADLARSGVSCAVCHLRGLERHGPPGRDTGREGMLAQRIATIDYPRVPLGIYERSDLCVSCHQLPLESAVGSRPLLDTYAEWVESPVFRRGIQCQSCHMPDRRHTWRGVHDRQTVREALAIDLGAPSREGDRVRAEIRLTNIGCGHHFPTTATPMAIVRVELLDAQSRPLAGTRQEHRIERNAHFVRGRWEQRLDTRIRAGDTRRLSYSARARTARALRVRVEMRPDGFYEGFFERRLARRDLPAAQRTRYAAALDEARKNVFVFYDHAVELR